MTWNRERAISILLLAGMTATFLAAVNLPGRRAHAAAQQEIKDAEATIARHREAFKRFTAEHDELDSRLAYLKQSAAGFAPVDPHELLGQISRLARASRLKVDRLAPEQIHRRQSFSEHLFRLDFKGELPAITQFLQGLEEGGRLYAIDELSIHASETGETTPALEGSVRFFVIAEHADEAGFDEESGSAGVR